MFEHADENRAEVDAILAASAYIMGRNMFGPVRGEWTGDWRGWWGPEPPYHGPVFVLTNHPREPLEMDGGTTFTFVTDGIESAMAQAREAAGDGDISIAGGADDDQPVPRGRTHRRAAPARRAADPRAERPRRRRPALRRRPAAEFASTAVRATPHVTHVTYTLR